MAKKKIIDRGLVEQELAALEADASASYVPSPSHLDLVERSRLMLVNVVRDEIVAEIGRDALGQGPSLLMTLMMCRGVFSDADALVSTLDSQPWSALAWRGARRNLRAVYGRLVGRLADTMFCLAFEGYYGFRLRASHDQREDMERRRQHRIERLQRGKRLARQRARDREEFGGTEPLAGSTPHLP